MIQEPKTRIHPHAVKAWQINGLLVGLLWFVPLVGYMAIAIGHNASQPVPWYTGIQWWLAATFGVAALGLYILTGFIIPRLRWKRWRYRVAEKEIDLLRGIIIKKRTLVPVNRVQHVDTRQGPVYRRYGLSSVTISTAATTHEIPALDDKTAEELRNKISTLVQKVKEDV